TDLHPKNFIRKHLLSEEDEIALRRPIEALHSDLKRDLRDVARAADLKAKPAVPAADPPADTPPATPAQAPAPRAPSYDLDAT
ncbi:MAG TPA: preprotein translocase subunit TatB, partial [Micromonosporaceae bacterium]|nr:preprotein translocase subunit TatB [Micromonosporaceae bacterium]